MIRRILVMIAAIAALVAGCKKDAVGPGVDGSPSDVVFPISNISYSRCIQPLFNQACALGGCHDAGQNQSQLHLTGYGDLMLSVNAVGVVIPGKPDASTLILRIQGSVGARMPPGVFPLNSNQINGIRAWIVEGAKNN
jgi:hypothetical protein